VTDAIRVLVADDQTVVRDGLTALLGLLDGIEVVGVAADGDEAVARAAELRPDVVLMDLRMPHCDGALATGRLREQAPDVRVVVLTTYADDESVLSALRAGALGYLTKDADAGAIERAVRSAHSGQAVLDPSVQARLVSLAGDGPAPGAGPGEPEPRGERLAGLTEREAEVLALMADGLANREIARRLFVTEATVKTHVNNIFGKLDVGDRAAAVAWAYRSGLAAG
jgi:DNA-binding NarL/FixJ family response regulator